jgi:DNA transposition AAA+ family ATPase
MSNATPRSLPLTDTELAELRQLTGDFLELPFHALLRFQFARGLDGTESTVVIGPPGVGKTYALEQIGAETEAAEAERARESNGAHVPRRIFRYIASAAVGRKSALVDLYEALTHRELSAGNRRMWTPKHLLERIVDELVAEQVHLVVIDEAQFIDAHNLDLLRQVVDVAAERRHPMGLVLAGTESLRDAVVETGQLGQRFATEIQVPRIAREEVGPFLDGMHPHLPALRSQLGAKAWATLLDDLFAKVNGKFRRLEKILKNAHAIVLQNRERLTEADLRTAIDKLAAEQ